MTPFAWKRIQRRAQACGAIALRTDQRDGPVSYLLSSPRDSAVFQTFKGAPALIERLAEVEREYGSKPLRGQTPPQELRAISLSGVLGGLSSKIRSCTMQLSGEMPIARATLVMAEAEGRNHLRKLEEQREWAIRERLRIADELASFTKRPPRYAEYLAAVHALDEGGQTNGH